MAKLWRAVGSGDVDAAIDELALHFDEPRDAICDVQVMTEPCDMRGERVRIWVKECRT